MHRHILMPPQLLLCGKKHRGKTFFYFFLFPFLYCTAGKTKCPSIFIDWKAPPLKLDFLEIELRTGEMSGCHRCSCAVGGGQCRSLCHSPSSLLLCCQSSSQVSYFYLVCFAVVFYNGLHWSEFCRRYAAKKLKNVLPSKFVLNQSRSRVSPMAQRNQDEVGSQGIELGERPADPTRHMWDISYSHFDGQQ